MSQTTPLITPPFSNYGGPEEVLIGNGSGLPITHTRTSLLNSHKQNFILNDVLCFHL